MKSFEAASTAVVLAVGLAGCSVTALMVPVEGPLSEMKPRPAMEVKAKGVTGNSGAMTLTMPDGDACAGKWASAAGSGFSVDGASLLGQYGPTYISGWSMSPGRGQNPGQAIVTCKSGRIVEFEFVTGAGTGSGFGIGKDSDGNIYRLVF